MEKRGDQVETGAIWLDSSKRYKLVEKQILAFVFMIFVWFNTRDGEASLVSTAAVGSGHTEHLAGLKSTYLFHLACEKYRVHLLFHD